MLGGKASFASLKRHSLLSVVLLLWLSRAFRAFLGGIQFGLEAHTQNIVRAQVII